MIIFELNLNHAGRAINASDTSQAISQQPLEDEKKTFGRMFLEHLATR